tara:strand:+ start:179 stop:445 length:267 start_codon:yes stop_codon:yes gene_type:complete
MALSLVSLGTDLFNALKAAQADPGPNSQKTLCDAMAVAIDAFVRSADVVTDVTGTASAGTCTPGGPVTGAIVQAQGTAKGNTPSKGLV